MSISDAARIVDKRETLAIMLQHVGDHDVRTVTFSTNDDEVKGVLPTTWRELLDDNLIDDEFSAIGLARFRLTSAGWLRAVASDPAVIDSDAFRERCRQLVKALKSVVKGRDEHYDRYMHVDEVAASTGLPEGWIHNVIRSRLLGVVFPRDRWDVQEDRGMLRISPTFGLNALDD
jgi:hypothetical protein